MLFVAAIFGQQADAAYFDSRLCSLKMSSSWSLVSVRQLNSTSMTRYYITRNRAYMSLLPGSDCQLYILGVGTALTFAKRHSTHLQIEFNPLRLVFLALLKVGKMHVLSIKMQLGVRNLHLRPVSLDILCRLLLPHAQQKVSTEGRIVTHL